MSLASGPLPAATDLAPAKRMGSLRAALIALTAPPLLLLALAGAVLVIVQWQAQRDAARDALADAARTLALSVDRELAAEQTALEAMALSPLIDRADWPAVYRLSAQFAQRHAGALMAVTDARGQLLFNTAVPLGTPLPNLGDIERENRHVDWLGERLPVSSRGLTRSARETGRAAHSDLYFGVTIRRPTLAMVVPVLRDGAVPYTLTLSYPPDALSALLRTAPGAAGYRLAIIDRGGRVVAATSDAQTFIGRSVPAAFTSTAGGPAEVRERPYLDGSAQVVAVARSELAGWTVVAATPADTMYAPVRSALAWWLLALAVVLLAAWWLAARVAYRLAAPLRQLTARLGAHPPATLPAWPAARVREIAQLTDALRRGEAADEQRNEAELRRRVAEARESEALRAAEDLRSSETQLRLALDAGGLAFWRLDFNTGRVQGDARFRALWDVPADAPDSPLMFDRIHPEDREAVKQLTLPEALERSGRYDGEFRLLAADGSIRWLAASATLERDSDDRPVAMIGVNADITSRKRLEQQLREQSVELQEASRRKDHFLAMLGHELRNPLSPISIAAETMRLAAHDPARVRATADIVTRQVRHMVRLIDDLLDVARITQGKIHLQPAPVALDTILRDAVETARPLIDARRHQLKTSIAPESLFVNGDATRLVQVVANLLTNAAKYTDEGGCIALALARDGACARIEVSDNGIGLAPQTLEKVFEAFMQTPGALGRAQGGLGMGLAVVRRLVQMHGGEVRAASEGLGHGSRFTVTLPLIEPPQTATSTAAGATPSDAGKGDGMHVLVVDDNQDAADSLATMLTLSGYQTEVAYHAKAALALAAASPPRVAVLDIGLPEMDGRELARHLRQLPSGRDMLLIAVTGYGRLDEDGSGPANAFDHHLVKPVDIERVTELIGRWSGQHARAATAEPPRMPPPQA